MISFPKDEILALCVKYGPLLQAPEGLDGAKVMAAIGAVESGGGNWEFIGHDCGPRHEPSYDYGGANCSQIQETVLNHYGSPAGACSYGPWQVMFVNSPGYTVAEMETSAEDCARVFVSFFNSYVIRGRKASSLAEIGEVFNAGHVIRGSLPPGVERYVEELTAAYNSVVLPEGA